MLRNSYIHPNINWNNLHAPLRLSSPAPGSASTRLGSGARPVGGDGCMHGIGSTAKATTGNSPSGKHPSTLLKPLALILRPKCLPLPQHPMVHAGRRRRHRHVLRSFALHRGLGWVPPVSPSGPGDTLGWEGYTPSAI